MEIKSWPLPREGQCQELPAKHFPRDALEERRQLQDSTVAATEGLSQPLLSSGDRTQHVRRPWGRNTASRRGGAMHLQSL